MAAKRTVEQVMRELERRERERGLLAMAGAPATMKGGLLSSAAMPPVDREASRAALGDVVAAVDARPNVGNGADSMRPEASPRPVVGLLGTAPAKMRPSRGLLSPEGMADREPERSFGLGQIGSFIDDFIGGGAMGRLAAERRARERTERQQAAHDRAFALATGKGAFDPEAYALAMAEQGVAPDMAGLMQLEGVADSQDVRGMRGREERREVTAGALAPILRADEAALSSALPGVLEYLQSQGMPYSGPTDPAALSSAVGAGMGANAYLDNDRGERALAENIRSNVAGEEYRNRDFGFRQQVDERNFGYQRERDRADDAYRYSRAEAEDSYRRWQMENDLTRSDIEGRVLRKAIEQGAENLTPEERAVYDRAVTVTGQGAFGWGGMMPGVPGVPGAVPGVAPPSAPPSAPARQPQGNGTRQAPARPMSEADFESLPVGAWFINPADGRVMQKER